MKQLAKEIREKGIVEFILTYKNLFLESIWYKQPYVISHNTCHFVDRYKYKLIIQRYESDLKILQNGFSNGEFEKRLSSHQRYAFGFEQELSKEEKKELAFLSDCIENLRKVEIADNDIKEIIQKISKDVQICIDSSMDDNYIYSKAYCKDPNYYYQRDITQLENEIKILKKHNEFSLKFIAKEKDYLNNLKLELANYF